jgi:transcriptional regulator with XRE-family HTH domain
MSTQRQISENVETLLRRAGKRQEDLAEALHLNRVSVSQRITGRTVWRADELDGIAAFFDVTVVELVSRIPDFQEWDRRRKPAAVSGPRFFVMPEASSDGTPPLTPLSRLADCPLSVLHEYGGMGRARAAVDPLAASSHWPRRRNGRVVAMVALLRRMVCGSTCLRSPLTETRRGATSLVTQVGRQQQPGDNSRSHRHGRQAPSDDITKLASVPAEPLRVLPCTLGAAVPRADVGQAPADLRLGVRSPVRPDRGHLGGGQGLRDAVGAR